MEVVLRADQAALPPDDNTFVSLRIGQVHKQVKLDDLLTYRFNNVDPASKAPVKLEVFKRVGQTTVTFGGSTGDIQDVEVPVTNGKAMRMRLSTSTARATTPATSEKVKSKQVNSARSYLAQHNLEHLLKEAMKEVINTKPADPHEYLASYILKAGNRQGGLLPKVAAADELPIPKGKSVQSWGWANAEASAPEDSSANRGALAHPRTLPPIEGKQLVQSASAPALRQWTPSQALPTQALPQALALVQKSGGCVIYNGTNSPVTVGASGDEPNSKDEACGSSGAATALVPSLSQTVESEKQVKAQPEAPVVPWRHRPSVATWCSVKPKAVQKEEQVKAKPEALVTPWRHCPSVATWVSLKPVVKPAEVQFKPEPAGPVPTWKHRPSVATWASLKPFTVPPLPVEPVFAAFTLRPSVATWCAPLPCPVPAAATAPRKWNLLPSTATWCSLCPPQRSLEQLTQWLPTAEESQAMDVLLGARKKEINALSVKLRTISVTLDKAKITGDLAQSLDLEKTTSSLEQCITYAQSEYDALEQWGARRGLSQPSSPANG